MSVDKHSRLCFIGTKAVNLPQKQIIKMKRYRTLLCTLSILLFHIVNINAEIVTRDSAAVVAKAFMKSMGLGDRELAPLSFHTNGAGNYAKYKEAPAYHIYTRENNEGFIIVSGDNIARPILGYSFDSITGDSISSLPPAMQDWLSEIENQIMQARIQGVRQSAEIAQEWETPTYSSTAMRLTTAQWHQHDPYNQQCPLQMGKRCVTGCVPTAYAILMKYYEFPASGRGETQGYTCEESGVYVASRNLGHSYQWNMMPLEYKNGQYTTQQANSISLLMADIGAAIKADYSVDATGAVLGHDAIFTHFGYNPGTCKQRKEYTIDEWYSMLRTELEKQRPILYRGSSKDGGHAFILDGYTNNNQFYINWGWGGHYNGAFVLDALTPGGTDYNSDQEAYFDCVPAHFLPIVAKVGNDIECPSLKAAISMAKTDGELTRITMLQDTHTEHEEISKGLNILLDLNGHSINFEYGIYNNANLCITDSKGTGKMSATGNSSIINNYGSLVVESGEFCNSDSTELEEGQANYRRCIWTAEGSTTKINGGKFTCANQVICINSDTDITNGEFKCTGNSEVISNYARTGVLTIDGGVFENTSTEFSGNDYRRCVWTVEGSITEINGGQFTCTNQVICINGDTDINNGEFKCIGNSGVLSNYAKTGVLTINGGIFENTFTGYVDIDYRRCIWTAAGTTTEINGGDYTNESASQTLCFKGNAIITNGVIENRGSGVGCLSSGNVRIENCMICAKRILYAKNGATLKCTGGLYSKNVDEEFLEEGYECVPNSDATTSKYPFKVISTTGIDAIEENFVQDAIYYDLNGNSHTEVQHGINIIRKPNGKSVKILHR